MVESKFVLTSSIAFAMLAMAITTTIITQQEAYAKHHHMHAMILNLVHVPYDTRAFCGMNWQGNFYLSLGNASLSVPAGMCFPAYSATMGPSS